MNEEKGLLTTIDFGRVSKKGLAFTVSKLQKNESLPHSFFFDCKSSEVMFPLHENPSLSAEAERKLLPLVAIGVTDPFIITFYSLIKVRKI